MTKCLGFAAGDGGHPQVQRSCLHETNLSLCSRTGEILSLSFHLFVLLQHHNYLIKMLSSYLLIWHHCNFQVDGIAGSLESLKPTLATKCCFLCSLVYVILPIDLTYILMSGVLVAMKAGPLFGIPVDVLGPLENKFLPLIFGTVKKPEEKKEWISKPFFWICHHFIFLLRFFTYNH